MFSSDDILYEDNHLLVVNKRCGDLVQPDPSGQSALEDQIKAYIKRRDAKPGEVFLGVVHRIDRPVSGAVLFAKTSKALVRLNEMIRSGEIRKTYWAVTEQRPDPLEGELRHWVLRDGRIEAAGCFLPLSNNLEIGKDMGTRHRAALGMSENSDAVVVVVSEETGIISLAKNGVLIRRLDRQNLFNLLEGDMVPPAVEEKKRPFWRRKHEKQHE